MPQKFDLPDILKFDNSFHIISSLQNKPPASVLDCSKIALTSWELGAVARALLCFPSITSLKLGRCKMEDETVDMLLLNKSITSLDIDFPFEEMDTITLNAYAKLVRETTVIASFDSLFWELFQLDDIMFEDMGIKSLIDAIKVNKTITSITYECNGQQASTKFVKMIAEIIREKKSISELSLFSMGIENDYVIPLAEAIKNNISITSFALPSNCVGDDGAIALAEAIENNSYITSLCLHSNCIGNKGAIAFAESLKKNKSIISLDLSSNEISQEGMEAIVKALEQNHTIRELQLENQDPNLGRDLHQSRLSEFLKRNNKLYRNSKVVKITPAVSPHGLFNQNKTSERPNELLEELPPQKKMKS